MDINGIITTYITEELKRINLINEINVVDWRLCDTITFPMIELLCQSCVMGRALV